MINKILTFGDSYMYGTELPQDDPDIAPKIKEIIKNLPIDNLSGAVSIDLLKTEHFDQLWNIEMTTPDYEKRCHSYCVSGILQKHFKIIDYKNYSWAGYSNEAIISELIMNLNQITKDTLVIIGLTFPNRTTRLDQDTGYNKIKSINNFTSLAKNKEHERFIRLSMNYDNDTLTKYIHVFNHISSIKKLLKNIPHIIIDPINLYRESSELNNQLLKNWCLDNTIKNSITKNQENIIYLDLIDYLQKSFNENIFNFTFNHALYYCQKNKIPGRALLGHPSKHAHDYFANEFLIPYIKNNFF